MKHTNFAELNAECLKLLSVGIDVGSSTSHLIFSRLTLKRERFNASMSNRFVLVDRKLIYEGKIIFTPLLDKNTIDIEMLIKFFEDEYKNAGITPEQVDTGGVIVTGETAKKQNAAEIVQRLSSKSGKFVSAAAGPNFEALLAARGSGIVDLSREKRITILNVDIGGGSSKLAIVSKGDVRSTSSINIGGRLLGIDKDFKIWRIDGPTELVMKELGLKHQLGDIIDEKHVRAIARKYAMALVEVMRGPATSTIAKSLMMTEDLDFPARVDKISFSGGVAEIIYEIQSEKLKDHASDKSKTPNPYNDIGWYLAEEIIPLLADLKVPLLEPENKIRATVIGAGAFSMSISGSTCYYDHSIQLPLNNIPVVSIGINFRDVMIGGADNTGKIKEEIALALRNYNLIDGVDDFALFFNDINIRADLVLFSRSIVMALPKTIAKNKSIIIILGFDGAKMLGLTMKKEIAFNGRLFCLDELFLESGDWIDIGRPIGEGKSFPITIKSLVFKQNSQTKKI